MNSTCPICKGVGKVEYESRIFLLAYVTLQRRCFLCKGTGKLNRAQRVWLSPIEWKRKGE